MKLGDVLKKERERKKLSFDETASRSTLRALSAAVHIESLDQEGRGIGLANKIRAYELQDQGLDTVEANERLGFAPDLRHYGIGAQILVDLGVRNMRLLTNNPKKVVGLGSYGLHLVERVPIIVPGNPENVRYLETKRSKLGHLLEALEPTPEGRSRL